MTDPRELVPAFSTDVEPTDAGISRVSAELEAFAVEHGVADGVRARLADVTTDAVARLADLRTTPEPIVVEADIDQGNLQVVFVRELESLEAVADARSRLLSMAPPSDAFSVERAGHAAIEVWVCFRLA